MTLLPLGMSSHPKEPKLLCLSVSDPTEPAALCCSPAIFFQFLFGGRFDLVYGVWA